MFTFILIVLTIVNVVLLTFNLNGMRHIDSRLDKALTYVELMETSYHATLRHVNRAEYAAKRAEDWATASAEHAETCRDFTATSCTSVAGDCTSPE